MTMKFCKSASMVRRCWVNTLRVIPRDGFPGWIIFPQYNSVHLHLIVRTEFLRFRGFRPTGIAEPLQSTNTYSIPPKALPDSSFIIPNERNDIPVEEPFRPRIRMVKPLRDRPVSPEAFGQPIRQRSHYIIRSTKIRHAFPDKNRSL